MKRLTRTSVVLVTLFGLPAASRAGSVSVTIEPGPGASFAQQVGLDFGQLQSLVQSEIASAYQVLNAGSYLKNFSDAQNFTTRGLGVDYASNPTLLVVGAAANVSLNADDKFVPNSKTAPPIDGVGLNATFMAGVNLGFLGLKPVTLFGNFYKGTATINAHRGDLSNFGAHVQIKLLGPADSSRRRFALPIQWGGIDITSGIDRSQMQLSLASETLTSEIPVSGAAAAAGTVVLDSRGVYNLDLRTWTVPLEVTTNFRLLWLATVYGGLGFDWQLGGGGDMNVNLDGTLKGVARGQAPVNLGTVKVTASESTGPSVGHLRGILGVQANVFFVRLFAQLNWMADANIAGVGFGARLAW